jgi:rod shape-determining protein MreC
MNPNNFGQRIRWGLIVLLALVAIVFMVADATGNLDTVLGLIRDPMATVMGWTTEQTETVAESLSGPRDLDDARQRIAELETEVAALERTVEELRQTQGETALLQELFERVRETPDLERSVASVIAYNTSPYFQSIIIDRGTADGILVGMPVESARGLVGQVWRTSDRAAQVLLISDNISSLPARLATSRATGLLRGGGLGGSMTLNWIDLEAPVALGEVVVTSGLGGRFPPGIVLGQVIEVQRSEAELHQSATVQPAVDFDSLEAVFVITNFEPVDTTIFDTLPEP